MSNAKSISDRAAALGLSLVKNDHLKTGRSRAALSVVNGDELVPVATAAEPAAPVVQTPTFGASRSASFRSSPAYDRGGTICDTSIAYRNHCLDGK